jgi:exodeoxyribonuclease VII large subunit
LLRRLQALWRERLQHRHARLRHADAVLRAHHPARRMAQLQARLQRLQVRPRAAIARVLQRDALQLRALARSLEACSPLATVARGYSILTRADDGHLVHSTAQVEAGGKLRARVRDGVLSLSVDAVQADAPANEPADGPGSTP